VRRWLLGAAALLGGCATSTHSTTAPFGAIHTLREAHNNVHVIVGPKGLVLVDGGLEGSAVEVEARIRELGLDPARIRAVIITHGHADHAGGARHFQTTYGAQVIAGAGDQPLFSGGRNDALCPTSTHAEWRLDEDQGATYTPFAANVWVDQDLDAKPLTGLTGRILSMPGHTAGSLSLVVGEAAFVGDLFRGAIVGSSAVTHFYMCDLADNRRDIRGLLDAHPAVKTFFTGHFGPVAREEVERLVEEMAPDPG
jgi:hydroxyacylglutathione hydrolase